MGRLIPAFTQMFDGEGNPLANGWLQFNASGSNNTPKATYFDDIYQIPNENPLQLDAEGRVPSVFGVGDYRVISYINDPEDEDSPGEMIQMFDPVTAQGAVEGGGGSGAVFDAWSPSVTYDLGSIVEKDLLYYRSLINGNFNLDPLIVTAAWEQIDFLAYWNSAVTYETGNLIYYLENLYLSLQDGNVNHIPTTSPTWWRAVATGCKGYLNQTGNYSITSSDREYLVVLGPSTIADSTFDLPAMDATTNKFCVWIYNASDFVLTIDAAGSAGIWLNTGGTLQITKGSLIQLGYNSFLDCWLPMGNVGPTLGNQDIGTATYPVLDIHANNILSDTMTLAVSLAVDTVNVSTLRVPSDEFVYLGDADDISLSHTSLTPAFDINLAATNYLNIISNGVTFWTIDPSGALYPGATNPLPDVGSAANSLNFVYTDNISSPDNGVAYFGTGDDLQITFNGATGLISCSSNIELNASGTNSMLFVTNSQTLMVLHYTLEARFYYPIKILSATPSFELGATPFLSLSHTGAVGDAYFNNVVGDAFFQTNGFNVLSYDSSGFLDIYADTYMRSDNYLHFDLADPGYIGYQSANSAILLTATGSNVIWINTNSVHRWTFNASGHFFPALNNSYDIGTTSFLVRNIYTRGIDSSSNSLAIDVGTGANVTLDDFTETFTGGVGYRLYMTVTNTDTGRTFEFISNPIP